METMILPLGTSIRNQPVVPAGAGQSHASRFTSQPAQDLRPATQDSEACRRPNHGDFASVTDAQLLICIASGDSEALEALYDRYVNACYGLALRIVADPYIAEEIIQDIFLKLWTAPGNYAPERGKFSAWLLTLVHNRAIDRLRQEKRIMPTNSVAFDYFDAEETGGVAPAEVLADGTNTPYEETWRKERSRAVRKALSLLSAPQREAISLAYLGGLTQQEIARRLDVPLGTIKTRTRTGLQHLRRLLDGESLLGEGDAA